jgi:hypothetical protein
MNIRKSGILGIVTAAAALSGVACSSSSGEGDSEKPDNMSNAGTSTGPSGGSGNATAGTNSAPQAGTSSTPGGSGSEGGSASGGSAPVSTCGPIETECTAASAMETTPISDFETGQGWFLFANPDDAGGSTMPVAGANIMAEEIMCPLGGRCGNSSFAQHVSGKGFTSYGPSLSSDFVYKDGMSGELVGEAQDASMYTGIAFWARKGDTAGAAPTLRLIVNDVTSHELGGVCNPASAPGAGGVASDACWDGWMTERALPSTWTLIKVPFTALKQGGFGMQGEAIQPDKLYGLTFQMPNMATFDFWIDDVVFYKE